MLEIEQMRNHRGEWGNVNNMVKLLPNFNECDPENKVTSAAQAAVLADEFALTHKSSHDRSQLEFSSARLLSARE